MWFQVSSDKNNVQLNNSIEKLDELVQKYIFVITSFVNEMSHQIRFAAVMKTHAHFLIAVTSINSVEPHLCSVNTAV